MFIQEPVGKSTISPVPSAAHVRSMRKGSTDQLALDIDLESNRLINREETDEDKGLRHNMFPSIPSSFLSLKKIFTTFLPLPFAGHVFKSLNTSGLVPKQGKSIADRIDGIW